MRRCCSKTPSAAGRAEAETSLRRLLDSAQACLEVQAAIAHARARGTAGRTLSGAQGRSDGSQRLHGARSWRSFAPSRASEEWTGDLDKLGIAVVQPGNAGARRFRPDGREAPRTRAQFRPHHRSIPRPAALARRGEGSAGRLRNPLFGSLDLIPPQGRKRERNGLRQPAGGILVVDDNAGQPRYAVAAAGTRGLLRRHGRERTGCARETGGRQHSIWCCSTS